MSDVYDGQVWQEFLGPATTPLKHIILHFCMDGIPAFQCGSLSYKPGMCANYSVAPPLRMKPEYMLLLMLMPTNVKGFAQKKFFDYIARRELNELYETGADSCIVLFIAYLTFTVLFHTGIHGVKVKIFGTSMDTPGRAELLGSCAYIVEL